MNERTCALLEAKGRSRLWLSVGQTFVSNQLDLMAHLPVVPQRILESALDPHTHDK